MCLEVETRTVTDGTTNVKLSQRETALLEFLMRHQNRNFFHAVIREKVWPLDSEGSDDTVRTLHENTEAKTRKDWQKGFD